MHLFASQNEQVREYHKNLDFNYRQILLLRVHKYAGISSETILPYNGYKTWTLWISRVENVKSVYPVQPTIHFQSPKTFLEPQSENLAFNPHASRLVIYYSNSKMTSNMHEIKQFWLRSVGGRKPGLSQ